MDEETQKKVEATVLEILGGSDMESVTEYKVRLAAADRLGVDLSLPDRKLFVRRVVEDYLRSLPDEDEEPQEQAAAAAAEEGKDKEEPEVAAAEKEEEQVGGGGGEKEYDDDGDLILCRLSTTRRVTLQEFKGKTLVSIREFYSKDGKERPGTKGISLTVEQWEAFRDAVPAIEDAIKELSD